MHVCMLVKNSFEYDARVTKEARSLIGAGHEVTVVAIHAPGATARREERDDGITVVRVPRLYGRAAGLGGPATHVPGGGARSGGASVRRLLAPVLPVARAVNTAWLNTVFARTAASLAPDVVHAHDLNTLLPGVVAARRSGARLVYDAHELATERNEMGEAHRLLARTQERWLLPFVDEVITTNQTWAQYLEGLYRIPRPAVVRNVPERPTGREQAPDLRELANVAADEPLVLYQGSIQPNRGIEQAIDAIALLPSGTLVILGFGAHVPALRRRVSRLGAEARVRFLGPVLNEDLHAWTRQADVGLCTIVNSSLSYYTSLPNKLFEYVHAEIAQVTSDFPEMGRLVRQLGIGEVCDPGDPSSVAAAISRVLADPEPYRRHAKEAAARHHWGLEGGALLDVYGRLHNGCV